MATNPIIATRECKTAEELLASLSPATSSLWRRGADHIIEGMATWLFRGHANGAEGAVWTLLPTAHRALGAFLPFTIAQVDPFPMTASELRAEELRWVFNFVNIVNDQGLVVPGDTHELRDRRVQPHDLAADPTNFPPPLLNGMVALAQHHGVPTRFLDWSTKPLVAAYFASEPVARRREPGKKSPPTECPYFSVFALRRDVVELCRGRDPEIHILSVPSATNANLHAQGGQFTLVQPTHDPGEQALPTIDGVLRLHEDYLRAESPRRFPLLVEFRTPTSEARTALMTLSAMGVSGASVYPGLDGVVRAMRERRFYQWARPGERS